MVTILEETTKNPLTLMGKRAGICWGADITDDEKNKKRAIDCLNSGHGRVMEYVNVEMVLDGYSARVIREWYTHIAGGPTRLQASTRYIDYSNFDYVIPETIKNMKPSEREFAEKVYRQTMERIAENCKTLCEIGVPREDVALLLPLGMTTKIVDKRNLRSLVDMSHQRMCNRAYHEYRKLFNDVCASLSEVSDEWKYIVDNCFKPKCEVFGYCNETRSCGKMNKKN